MGLGTSIYSRRECYETSIYSRRECKKLAYTVKAYGRCRYSGYSEYSIYSIYRVDKTVICFLGLANTA